MRIIADHTRTTVMLIGDKDGILPSNTGAGYILRRIMRRAIRYCRQLGVETSALLECAAIFIDEVYGEAYPNLHEKKEYILSEIKNEADRFEATLAQGIKEFEKCVQGLERKNAFMAQKDPAYVKETVIGGKQAFRLYDTYGFPLELTEELALERGLTVDREGFDAAFKEHQEKSRVLAGGQFKGGLEMPFRNGDPSTTPRLTFSTPRSKLSARPTATQKGSNITDERMRFDFNFERPHDEGGNSAGRRPRQREDQGGYPRRLQGDEPRRGAGGALRGRLRQQVRRRRQDVLHRRFLEGDVRRAARRQARAFWGTSRSSRSMSSSAGVRRIKAILGITIHERLHENCF